MPKIKLPKDIAANWRDDPPTERQKEALSRLGVGGIPRTKGEASDAIGSRLLLLRTAWAVDDGWPDEFWDEDPWYDCWATIHDCF